LNLSTVPPYFHFDFEHPLIADNIVMFRFMIQRTSAIGDQSIIFKLHSLLPAWVSDNLVIGCWFNIM